MSMTQKEVTPMPETVDCASAIDALMKILRTSKVASLSINRAGWVAAETGCPSESGVSGDQLLKYLEGRKLPETVNVNMPTELIAEINEAKGLDIALLYKIQDALAKG